MSKLERILVVDVESTCWEGEPPAGETSDIIEIGVCLLDVKTLARSSKRSIMVKPARSEVSPFCTKLTTITKSDVADSLSLAAACQILKSEYRSRDILWASYGDYDRRQFERNCADLGAAYPFGNGHLNVKTVFALLRGLPKEVGMSDALAALRLPLEGTHHRGDDDAWNIAAILGALLAASRKIGTA